MNKLVFEFLIGHPQCGFHTAKVNQSFSHFHVKSNIKWRHQQPGRLCHVQLIQILWSDRLSLHHSHSIDLFSVILWVCDRGIHTAKASQSLSHFHLYQIGSYMRSVVFNWCNFLVAALAFAATKNSYLCLLALQTELLVWFPLFFLLCFESKKKSVNKYSKTKSEQMI